MSPIAESEHTRSDNEMEESATDWQCREVRLAAVETFGRLHHLNPEEVSPQEAACSLAGVIGLVFAVARVWDKSDPPLPVAQTNGIGNCAAISHEPTPETITVASTCRSNCQVHGWRGERKGA